MTSRRGMLFGIVAAYLALALAYTWPLPSRIVHGIAHDSGDPLLNAWILWWSTQAVPLTAPWWNAPIFYPAVGAFAFSEHLLGLAPIAAPLIALTHEPLLGYNVMLIATFVLSGLGAHFLGYTLTGHHDAAFVAGVAFAFAPYRLAQLPHIQVLASYWTPVCLAALHLYGREGGLRWAILAAGSWLMQALSCGYYLLFLSTLLALWFAWFAVGRWPVRRVLILAGLFIVAGLLLVPVLQGYQSILHDTYGFSRGLREIQQFSADIGGLLYATDELLVWGWLHVIRKAESNVFPGVTVVALAVLAIVQARPFAMGEEPTRTRVGWRWLLALAFTLLVTATVISIIHGRWRLSIFGMRILSIGRTDKPLTLAVIAALAWLGTLPRVRLAIRCRSAVAFYVAAAFAMWVFALGPDPMLLDIPVMYQAPYGWLMRLPGFDGLRVPARFWMMAVGCLSVVAALAVNRLQGRVRQTVVAIAVAGLLLDGWPGEFFVRRAPEKRPSPPGVAARLDLPMSEDRDALSLYQQMFDPVPLYNGVSGYAAPHQYAMREMLRRLDLRILQALTARGPLGVIIDHEADADGAIRKYVLSFPGAVTEQMHQEWSSYRLPRSAIAPPPDRSGTAVPIKSLDAYPSPPHAPRAVDGNLGTRWSGGVQQMTAEFTIELEQPSHVGQVVTDLGEFTTDFPQRLRIEVSADGTHWETVWLADTMLQAYYGAVRHPREVPLVFPLNRDGVRFIRLRQTGFGTHDWSIAEVHVLR